MIKVLGQIQFEDIKDGDRLRVFLDPGHTNLDYADGAVRTVRGDLYIHIEHDYWLDIERGALPITDDDGDLCLSTTQGKMIFQYFRIEEE